MGALSEEHYIDEVLIFTNTSEYYFVCRCHNILYPFFCFFRFQLTNYFSFLKCKFCV